jgi:hypothetical protein
MSLTLADQERAIEAVTSLGWISVDKQMLLSARAIAEALSITQEQGQAILVSLRDRELIEFRFQRAGGSLEGIPMPVNQYGAWFRMEPQ